MKQIKTTCLACVTALVCGLALAGEPTVRIETGAARAEVTALGWDTEGTGREKTNLLRPQTRVGLRIRSGGAWCNGIDLPTRLEADAGGAKSYWITVAPQTEINWRIRSAGGSLTMQFSGRGADLGKVEGVELVFPFAPSITPVTALSSVWDDDGRFYLPALLSAPDFGQMMLTGRTTDPNRTVVRDARLEGYRGRAGSGTVDLVLELAPPQAGAGDTLEFSPHILAPPPGLANTAHWPQARRGWFNVWQPTAQWGQQGTPFSAPAGLLGNNVISDIAGNAHWFYADHAFLTPEAAPGMSMMPLVRRIIDYYPNGRSLKPDGEMENYCHLLGFIDVNAGMLIASWDYVESTGDKEWLNRNLAKLERIADYLAKRDVDNDGLVEAKRSGNRSTLIEPARFCSWWDVLNSGHKDAYCNALIYRVWRCHADLEKKLGRSEQQGRYTQLADKLKAAYARTFLNPKTGWLAWWISADGEMHDYAGPTVNGLAIEYGLVEPTAGREILAKLRKKMEAVGFTRFDLGVPTTLIPVLRADYGQPAYPEGPLGAPKKEDGTDTFQKLQNGGCIPAHTVHFLAAHYVVGDPEPADKILRAMLERQGRGLFRNGVRNAGEQGVEYTTWDGKPKAYEGYLAGTWRFLQAVLLREPQFHERLYRPLTAGNP